MFVINKHCVIFEVSKAITLRRKQRVKMSYTFPVSEPGFYGEELREANELDALLEDAYSNDYDGSLSISLDSKGQVDCISCGNIVATAHPKKEDLLLVKVEATPFSVPSEVAATMIEGHLNQ